ncbi:RHS repeat-associated core domain-containing protein [Pseudomonas syringae]|uniref:RHS repeat-associated core domain-containing protein n=1 Tax=Pseudomonas syringae TaxID=317 RepID=UPI003F74C22C
MAILCKYTYDPLDRVSTLTPLAQAVANRFYNREQLMTELQGGRQRTYVRAGGQLLAQQSREGDEVMTTMIAGDLHNSVLHASKDGHQADIAYTPFGHHQAGQASAELPGFNGEQPDPLTGHYLLGNGYRAYNPVLMRFNSPDSMSPFGKGGLNAYAYCVGDPVNRVDPTGHISIGLAFLSGILFSAVGAGAIGASASLKGSDSDLSTILGVVGSVSLLAGAMGFASTIRKWRGAKLKFKDVEKSYKKKLSDAKSRSERQAQLFTAHRQRSFEAGINSAARESIGARDLLVDLKSADVLIIDGITFYSDTRMPLARQILLYSQFRETGRTIGALRLDAQSGLDARIVRGGQTLSQNNYRVRKSPDGA